MAAPVELAVALPGAGVLVRVVAPPAAHQVTALRALGSPVALSPHRAQRPRLRVVVAVVGRPLQVHQVLPARLAVLPLGPLQHEGDGRAGPPAQVRLHQLGFLVALADVVADLPEGRQGGPARLHGAGAGHPVTLAFRPHAALHRLQPT